MFFFLLCVDCKIKKKIKNSPPYKGGGKRLGVYFGFVSVVYFLYLCAVTLGNAIWKIFKCCLIAFIVIALFITFALFVIFFS